MLEAYSVSHGKASPYLPLIELLKSYFDITVEDDERKRREKVNGKVLTLDRSLEDTLPYLFALLGIEDPTSSLPQMDPQIRRRRTFNALKRLFLRESLNQPLMLIFEDLHWIDSETQGFLDVLSESVASARDHLEQSIALYDPQHHHSLAFLVGGEELGVVCRDRVAVTLWWLGYPAQALQRMHEALTLAQELRSPFNLAFALGFAAMLHQFRQEGQLIQERAEALLALSHEQGFVLWLGWGSILRGWALAEQGQAEEGIAQICRGLAALQATGTKGSRPYFLALLAEAYEKVGGRPKKGLMRWLRRWLW